MEPQLAFREFGTRCRAPRKRGESLRGQGTQTRLGVLGVCCARICRASRPSPIDVRVLTEAISVEEVSMAVIKLDARGLKCPQPVLRIAGMLPQMPEGDILEASADCATFEEDVRKWCQRMKKPLLLVQHEGHRCTVRIQF